MANFERSSRENQGLRKRSAPVNIDQATRLAVLLGTGAIALHGLTRRSIPGLVMAAVAGTMFVRCLNGKCDICDLQSAFFDDRHYDPHIAKNPVEEASWESFPASDPPAMARSTGF